MKLSKSVSSEKRILRILKAVREQDYYGVFIYFILYAFIEYLNTNELRCPKIWIISKVEDSWKTTEFVVLPHRDTKDVFILGGTDDIQVGNWIIENLW